MTVPMLVFVGCCSSQFRFHRTVIIVMEWTVDCLPKLVLLAVIALQSDQILADDLSKRIDGLIEQLGDNQYATRQAAQRELRKIGPDTINALRNAFDHKSPEVRGRAKQLVAKIHFGPIHRRFAKLQTVPDEEIDIEEGMWLISRIVDHSVDHKMIKKQLDDLAAQVKKRLGAIVEPSKADPRKVLAAIHQVLFVDNKFDGDHTETYDHPKNSSIGYVLKNRQGLPIILSHIMVAIAERLDFPLVGLPVAGRYMVKYDSQKAPKEFPMDDLIINPFDGGMTMTVAEFNEMWGSSVSPLPATRRSILERMVRNLASDCLVVSDLERAQHAERILATLDDPLP
jgi:regulator of sirC expression with transglutaminase-like and TPR domain